MWFTGISLFFIVNGIFPWAEDEHRGDLLIAIVGIASIGPMGDWLTYWLIRRWGIQPEHFPETVLGVAKFFISGKYNYVGKPPSGGA